MYNLVGLTLAVIVGLVLVILVQHLENRYNPNTIWSRIEYKWLTLLSRVKTKSREDVKGKIGMFPDISD